METAHERYMRENREFFRAHGMCTTCGATDAYTMAGRWLCSDCTDRQNQYRAEYREKNREKLRADDRNRRAARKAAGLCVKCGRDMEGDRHSKCASCRAWEAAYRRSKRINLRGIGGLCMTCGKEMAMAGRKLCPACYETAFTNLAKGRAVQGNKDHPWRRDEQLRVMAIGAAG